MLHLRAVSPVDVTDRVLAVLKEHPGATHVVLLRGAAIEPAGDVVEADIAREATDEVVASLCGLGIDKQGGDPEPGGAEPDLTHHLILEGQARVAAGHEHSSERHHGCAVDVVVHHGLVEGLYKAGLYLEALRRRDVLQVDAAERRRYAYDGFDELVDVFRID